MKRTERHHLKENELDRLARQARETVGLRKREATVAIAAIVIVGAAALGHPATSTAWLANKLSEFGIALAPGDIVISGGITKMLPVKAGDAFVFTLTGQPSVTVTFT